MQLHADIDEAKDNLLQAKISQTHYANQNRSPDVNSMNCSDKTVITG
jgi:hypothetical protein